MRNPQLSREGTLAHLLCTEGLSKARLLQILDATRLHLNSIHAGARDRVNHNSHSLLIALGDEHPMLVQALTEAAERLGLVVLAPAPAFSLPTHVEGWSLALQSLASIGCDLLVVRHPVSGTPYFLAEQLSPKIHVVNAGDGCHAEPLEALVELFLMRETGLDFNAMIVAISGPLDQSGFGRSLVHALTTLGVPEVQWVRRGSSITMGAEQLGLRVVDERHRAPIDANIQIDLDIATVSSDAISVGLAPEYLVQRQQIRVAVCMAVFARCLEAL